MFGKMLQDHIEGGVTCFEGLVRALASKITSPHPGASASVPILGAWEAAMLLYCVHLHPVPMGIKTKGPGTTLPDLKSISNTF